MMRVAQVEYPSGREMLRAYWGFLATGGLILGEPAGLAEGDAVRLDVKITSLKKVYHLTGHVKKADDGRALVAFDDDQAHGELLNAAWADSHGVPQRRHRRYDLGLQVRYRIGDAQGRGRIVNLSRGGCCLEAEHTLRIGTRLHLEGEGFAIDGRVRWAKAASRQMGIEFSRFQDELVSCLTPSSDPSTDH
jgi:hypothetical protein